MSTDDDKFNIVVSTDCEYAVAFPNPAIVEELISLLTVREPVNAALPSTPKLQLTITCPIKSCLSLQSSPNTFEPLENITEADSSVT